MNPQQEASREEKCPRCGSNIRIVYDKGCTILDSNDWHKGSATAQTPHPNFVADNWCYEHGNITPCLFCESAPPVETPTRKTPTVQDAIRLIEKIEKCEGMPAKLILLRNFILFAAGRLLEP